MKKSERIDKLKKLANTPAEEYFKGEIEEDPGFALDKYLSKKKREFERLFEEKDSQENKQIQGDGVSVAGTIPNIVGKVYYADTEKEVNKIIKEYIESLEKT